MKRIAKYDCQSRITNIQFSSDGAILAGLTDTNALQFWSTAYMDPICRFHSGHSIKDFSLSPDGKMATIVTWAASTEPSASVVQYDISQGIGSTKTLDKDLVSVAHCDSVIALGRVFQPGPNMIQLFDFELTYQVAQLVFPTSGSVRDFAASLKCCPTTNLLSSAGVGATIWDLTSKEVVWDYLTDLASGTIDQQDNDVWETTCLGFSANGRWLAVGFWGTDQGKTTKIAIISFPDKQLIGWIGRGFQTIYSVAVSPDGQWVAGTGAVDTRPNEFSPLARVWNLDTGQQVAECELPGMSVVAFGPEGNYLWTGANPPDSIVKWQIS